MVRSTTPNFKSEDEPEMSRKEKNRLAAARFRSKQKSEIQLFKELCESQATEIAHLRSELKISRERVGELSRLLDIAITYYGEPTEVESRLATRSPIVTIGRQNGHTNNYPTQSAAPYSPDFNSSYSSIDAASSSYSPNYCESTSTISSPDLDLNYFNPEMTPCGSQTSSNEYTPSPDPLLTTNHNNQYYAESDNFYCQTSESQPQPQQVVLERPTLVLMEEDNDSIVSPHMPIYQPEPIGDMLATPAQFHQTPSLFKKYFG